MIYLKHGLFFGGMLLIYHCNVKVKWNTYSSHDNLVLKPFKYRLQIGAK